MHLNKYKKIKVITLYILFFLDNCMGIKTNIPIVIKISEINLKFEKENIGKNIISIGSPIYKLSHPYPIPVTIYISLWHYCSDCFTHIFSNFNY